MIDAILLALIIVFYALFFGRTIMLMARGIMPLAIGAGKKGARRAVEAAFLAGLLWWTFEIVMHSLRTGFHLLPAVFHRSFIEFPALRIAGAVFVAAGIGVFAWALVSFGASWRIGVDTKNPGGLVTTGVFRFTRNPIFLAMDAVFFGTFLVYGNPFFIALFLLFVAGSHYQILSEEKFLVSRYGAEYDEYRSKVRRYF